MAKNKAHYVNNKEFSQAVMDYAIECRACREKNKEVPNWKIVNITTYISFEMIFPDFYYSPKWK